ncbi:MULTISPECIES: PilT/PilU family type 4a pilus ATPase [unclassified Neptuniibacter]|uniref:type IV pilus twitching motility protein PilT n=1 Tax=unclassified Neptuniibacter TaxID=2630693 RepID=UPI0025E9883F|nr:MULTISPECIES: PilT/PilU family type 4a pilus ATPase [unclassified Neptuniibacter]
MMDKALNIEEYKAEFEALLALMLTQNASDLHCSAGVSPVLRIHGELIEQTVLSSLNKESLACMAEAVLSADQYQHLMSQRSFDLGYSNKNGDRFRLNFYFERGCLAFAIRSLHNSFATFEQLRLPSQLESIVDLKDGLVLVTGTTGSGKSTTLASIINKINETRACHILTIEDPIEFIHTNNRAVVHQREVGDDVLTFADAIRSAMREDPDVMLLGEMRDLETMHAAITAAETGHLVFATLHTNDAVGVIDRLIGMFPGDLQNTVRQQLSMSLRAVVTQTLVRTVDDVGRVPINEIVMVNSAVSNLIREHSSSQIRSVMETGRAQGNQTLEFALAQRVKDKLITRDKALQLTTRKEQFENALRVLNR